MKRRNFLKSTALSGVGAFASMGLGLGQVRKPELPISGVKNIIFMVYDGFSWEDFVVARHYAHRHQGRTLALERLFSLGTTGSMMTHSLTSIVTDSAAASTAWSTGCKTGNANLGVFPNGRPITTIFELAKQMGLATGIITTTRVTHATPAGFAVHTVERDEEDHISQLFLDVQPNVILGGGSRHYDPEIRKDGKDIYSLYQAQGYAIARSAGELENLEGSKVLGTFSRSHLPFEIDRKFQGVEGPSLSQITRKGLELLSEFSKGFIAQVEAGRIDHANHNNDPGSMMWDVLAADEALELVLNFADRNPGTLVILASDHGTGGGAIYGVGRNYHRASASFDRISGRRASYDYVFEQLGKEPQVAEVHEAVNHYLGATLSDEEARLVVEAIQGNPSLAHTDAYHEQPANSLAWYIAEGRDYFHPQQLNIHYTAGQHTAGPVPISVYSREIPSLQLGLVDNTDVFDWLTQALNIDHKNEPMSEKEALSFIEEESLLTGTAS